MARLGVIPRACTLLASCETLQTVLLILIAVGIMSAYSMARKASKEICEDDSKGKDDRDDSNTGSRTSSVRGVPRTPDRHANIENELDQMLRSGRGLDALSNPPLPTDGERTRYSPPDKNQNDLRPQPLRVQRNSSTDDEESPTSFIDMLKSDPNELLSLRKIKTPGSNGSPISTTPPSDENVNPFPGGRPYFTYYNSETGQYRHVFLKGSNFSRNAIDKQHTMDERDTYRTDTDPVDAFNVAHKDGTALEVSSPTRESTRSVSKPSPLSTVRRKVSSMFTKENLDEANDSILSPSTTKSIECTKSLGSADEMPIADSISTPTRKQLTRKASWIKTSLTKVSSGDTGAHPGEVTSPPSTPLSNSATWKPFSVFEGLEKTRNFHRTSSAASREQSLGLKVIDESGQSYPSARNPKSFTSATSPLMGTPASAYGEPAMQAFRHPRVQRAEASSLTDGFGVDPASDVREPLPTSTPTTDQSTNDYGKSRSRLLSNTGTSHPFNTFNPLQLPAKVEKSSKPKTTLTPIETGDFPTKPLKLSKISTTTYTDESTSHAASSLLDREHGPRSQQHEDFKVARPPCSVPRQSVDHNRSEIASSEEGHQDVKQKFFFEEFHANDLRTQEKVDANNDNLKSLRKSRRQRVVKQGESEVKAEATLNADTKQSEGPVAKETPTMSHDKTDTIPNIPEMDEATCQKEIASKEDSARKERAARQQQTSEEFIASKVAELRKNTKTEIVPYSPTDLRPRHPNHHRTWNARNLMCTRCDQFCGVCGIPCCMMALALAVSINAPDPENLAPREIGANNLALHIDRWVGKVGPDQPTFMECTQCHKKACPDCCSVCPVFPCHDRLCKGCNPRGQWKCCKFHPKADIPDSVPNHQRWSSQRK